MDQWRKMWTTAPGVEEGAWQTTSAAALMPPLLLLPLLLLLHC